MTEALLAPKKRTNNLYPRESDEWDHSDPNEVLSCSAEEWSCLPLCQVCKEWIGIAAAQLHLFSWRFILKPVPGITAESPNRAGSMEKMFFQWFFVTFCRNDVFTYYIFSSGICSCFVLVSCAFQHFKSPWEVWKEEGQRDSWMGCKIKAIHINVSHCQSLFRLWNVLPMIRCRWCRRFLKLEIQSLNGLVGFVAWAVFHLSEAGGVELPLGLIFYNP